MKVTYKKTMYCRIMDIRDEAKNKGKEIKRFGN